MINKTAISYQPSAVGSQQSIQHRNIEELKGRKDPEALQAAAKELEALFAYEMIKAMRQTTETTKGGLGKDAYMSLFDTELSKIFADRGLGLKDVLLRGLNRQMNKGQGDTRVQGFKGSGVQEQISMTQSRESVGHEISNSEQNITVKGHKAAEVSLSLEPSNPWPPSEKPAIPVDGLISSKFGMRKHPIYGDNRFHHGMDIAAPEGTKVYPYQRGKVIFSGEQAGYGNTIVVDHGNGYQSRYAHNRINLVKAGDVIDEDTVIAEVGSTGHSTGPHLHFEIRQEGKYLDPARVLALK